jgi:hypothetical protein
LDVLGKIKKNVSPLPGFEPQINPARNPLITPTPLFDVFVINWCKIQRWIAVRVLVVLRSIITYSMRVEFSRNNKTSWCKVWTSFSSAAAAHCDAACLRITVTHVISWGLPHYSITFQHTVSSYSPFIHRLLMVNLSAFHNLHINFHTTPVI